MSKPKEWWIKKNQYVSMDPNFYEEFDPVVSETELKTGIHDIEKSAYDEVVAARDRWYNEHQKVLDVKNALVDELEKVKTELKEQGQKQWHEGYEQGRIDSLK